MSETRVDYTTAELDARCECGDPMYQHDDGLGSCAACSTCGRFIEAARCSHCAVARGLHVDALLHHPYASTPSTDHATKGE